jgi:hypothetical protein
MLVMFAAGTASLIWMAALTALMVYEKTARHGDHAVPLAGIALLAWATPVLVHPAGLPVLLRASPLRPRNTEATAVWSISRCSRASAANATAPNAVHTRAAACRPTRSAPRRTRCQRWRPASPSASCTR